MKIHNKIQSIINDIQNGKLNKHLKQIDNSDFGLYIPAFEDQGIVKPIRDGYSQKEQYLAISIEKNNEGNLKNGCTVGWLSGSEPRKGNEISICDHVPDPDYKPSRKGNEILICDYVPDRRDERNKTCREINLGIDLAPELDYIAVAKQIDNKQELLNCLADYGLGLTILHGHNNRFMFTALPEGYISVIANGITTFRKDVDVAQDRTFVPSTWRSIDSKLRVAGGHSQLIIN